MAVPSTKITFAEDLGTEVVSLCVGPERKHYVVHKELLTSQSDYFDKALNGRFKEAEEGKIYLEEDDPAAVGLLVGWLYRGIIPGVKKASPFAAKSMSAGRMFKECVNTQPAYVPKTDTLVGYVPTNQPDVFPPYHTESFLHICCDPKYVKFSPEELRMSDYGLAAPASAPPTIAPQAVGNPPPAPRLSLFGQPCPVGSTYPDWSTSPFSLSGSFGPDPSSMSGLMTSTSTPQVSSGATNLPSTFGSVQNPFRSSTNYDTVPPGLYSRLILKAPGEFGYYPRIYYPKPEGRFIPGIPRSEPLGNSFVEDSEYQMALLHLCILAETICWPKLFNVAIETYIQGELELRRDIPLEAVDLIYTRTHTESTLRRFVMDSIRRLTNAESHKTYRELAQHHDEFLENLLRDFSMQVENRAYFSRVSKESYFIDEGPVSGHALRN